MLGKKLIFSLKIQRFNTKIQKSKAEFCCQNHTSAKTPTFLFSLEKYIKSLFLGKLLVDCVLIKVFSNDNG
jgi:hypothetical protein